MVYIMACTPHSVHPSIHPSIHRWMSKMFPPFSYCEQCCSKYECTNICSSPCFQFLWACTQKCNCWHYSMLNFSKNHHTVFHSGCTILHFHRQQTRVPISPHHQHLLFSVSLIGNSHPNGCEVVSHCVVGDFFRLFF